MKIQDAYTHWSETYDFDRNLTRDLDQTVSKQTLGRLRFNSILEIGCGTGKNTALLTRIGNRVLALDLSVGMLKQARQKDDFTTVCFAVADITRSWPCRDKAVELIVCNLVLEHVRDLSHIFGESFRVLETGGRLFVCELHPFRQYQGTQAHFQSGTNIVEIQAYVHHLSDFREAAVANGLALDSFQEWWHEEDVGKAPRLVSFMFQKH